MEKSVNHEAGQAGHPKKESGTSGTKGPSKEGKQYISNEKAGQVGQRVFLKKGVPLSFFGSGTAESTVDSVL